MPSASSHSAGAARASSAKPISRDADAHAVGLEGPGCAGEALGDGQQAIAQGEGCRVQRLAGDGDSGGGERARVVAHGVGVGAAQLDAVRGRGQIGGDDLRVDGCRAVAELGRADRRDEPCRPAWP